MRTSRKCLDEAYLKIFPMQRQQGSQPPEPKEMRAVPVEEPQGADQKHLSRNRRYYEENKEKVLKKQKEYKDSRSPEDNSRVRVLHYLNNEPDYNDRMMEATKKKYNFKKENGRRI